MTDDEVQRALLRAYHVTLDALDAPADEWPCNRVKKLVDQLHAAMRQMQSVAIHQATPWVHPLTCGNNSKHRALYAAFIDGKVVLRCADCTYVQTFVPSVANYPNPLATQPYEP